MDQLPFEPPPQPVYEDPDAPEAKPLSPLGYFLLFPAALVVAKVARVLVLPAMLVDGVRLWLHEWGHAIAAWACGWWAIPLPIGFTPFIEGRSWLVIAVWQTLWGLWTWRTFVAEHYVASAVGALALVAQWVGAFVLTHDSQEALALFGGCAGELVLSAALIAMFPLRFSRRTRWAQLRWALWFLGGGVFVEAFSLWNAARTNGTAIPWGSLYGSDSDGDMNRLADVHHWSVFAISARYFALACVCALAVWAGLAWRALLRRRELAEG